MPSVISKPVPEQHLANVIGEEALRNLHVTSKGFTIPVPVAGTPFYAVGGDIINEPQRMQDILGRRIHEFPNRREAARPVAWDKGGRAIMPIAGGGFTSLSDLISEATTGGKTQIFNVTKGASGTKVVGRGWSYWRLGAFPVAGAAGGTTGTGVARVRTDTGALGQANAGAGDTLHVTTVTGVCNVGANLLIMYDRLWDMTHTMTVDPRSCDAVNPPTRYQGSTTAPGNFLSGEVTTVLPAATPTITFNYVDESGNNSAGSALSTIASAAAVNSIPFTAPYWFYPLIAGDTGIRSLQNSASAVDLSAAMASGVCTWFIGHPLMAIPSQTTNVPVVIDGINSAFNLTQVVDGACISFLESNVGATTTSTWNLTIQLVSG